VKIALFGGTFDPVHIGHLKAARAAIRRFSLDRVLFVPCGKPPHKLRNHVTPYPHRFAMVALAARGEPKFVPSLLEAPKPDGKPNYSVETAGRVRRMLSKKDRLYFLLGLDAFLDLPNWKDYRRLLGLAEFIVVSRPSFDSRQLAEVIEEARRGGAMPDGEPRLPLAALEGAHILAGVHVPVASRDIRRAARTGQPLAGLVPPPVEEYIVKEGLYCPGRPGRALR
jgi:nicotinate-nucleotide adenylyltransferase